MPECLVDKEGCSYHNDTSLLLKVIDPESAQVPRLSSAKADGLVVDLSVVMRSEAAVIKTSEYTYNGGFADHIHTRKGKLYF